MIVINVTTITIITTRPKPAYGRQGLAGSWGQDTDEVSTFLVFLTSHFAPAALSSDLTNLGPLMTMKIHLETLKNHGNQPKTMKNHEATCWPFEVEDPRRAGMLFCIGVCVWSLLQKNHEYWVTREVLCYTRSRTNS